MVPIGTEIPMVPAAIIRLFHRKLRNPRSNQT